MPTLLDHAKDVADEIGILRPSSLVGSEDITARRLLSIAKTAGEALYRAHDWSILHRLFEITTEADERNYAVPDDWGRPLGDTAWDRTNFWQMRGSLTPEEWQLYKSATITTPTLMRRYRLLVGPQAGSILIHPTPGEDGETLVVEYVSRFWCEDTNGQGKQTWSADTDVIRIDEELFKLGLMWRARRAFAPPYADEHFEYVQALREAKKADINMPTFSTAPARLPLDARVPEGSWPQS